MSRKPRVPKLPDPERRKSLEEFLVVLDQHPNLAYFRTVIRSGPERQLALFAALERSVVLGSPAALPPRFDDQADLLLCDILDVIDRNPKLVNQGSAYGPDRHLVNLQAFGVWRGGVPVAEPSALELFTTCFSALTAEPASSCPSSAAINSPASQEFGSGGELIGTSGSLVATSLQSPPSPQAMDGVLVASDHHGASEDSAERPSTGIIHHGGQEAGEQFVEGQFTETASQAGPELPQPNSAAGHSREDATGLQVPVRTVRRGRPAVLDELAKGRLLGLMSCGLSFRQAAAQLGVHHVTILNTLKRDEELAQQVSEARLDAISQPLFTVVQASRTNWRAAAWLAKFLEERRVRSYESTPEERMVEMLKRS